MIIHKKGISGSLKIKGSVTADQFIVGDVGIPVIHSANNLEISASNEINIFSKQFKIDDILVINPRNTTPENPLSGSIIVSGSGSTIKPYFYDGSNWNPFY